MISLSAGFPPPHVFPLSSVTLRLGDGTVIDLPDITAAQQYNASLRGYPPLVHWASNHVRTLHASTSSSSLSRHSTLITNGANHTLEMLTSLFLDKGDSILVEEYTYPVILESIAVPKGYRTIGVALDGWGIIPSALRQTMEEACAAAAIPGGPAKPKILYTVPTGHNPTGSTAPAHRRKEIYEIARQFDLWIIEDDPYFYLQWNTQAAGAVLHSKSSIDDISDEELCGAMPGLRDLRSCIPSYLSLDVDARVIRVDSFSKFLAPGVRLGFVTAREDVIDRLTAVLHTHTVGPCSLSQTVVASTLLAWGEAGLDAHLRKIQAEYTRRCTVLCEAASRELSGVAEWNIPTAGMFLWMKLYGVQDAKEVWDDLHDAKIIVCPGSVMMSRRCTTKRTDGDDGSTRGKQGNSSPYVRVAYSSVPLDSLREGMVRLGRVMRAWNDGTKKVVQQ